MTARGKWSGRLTPRHVQRRLSRHVNRFAQGLEERWSMDRLTAMERKQVQDCYLALVAFYRYRDKNPTVVLVRAARALYQRFGLACNDHISRCSHGTCRVCGHHESEPDTRNYLRPDAGLCP